MKCIFCKIIKDDKQDRKVWQNKDFLLLLDIKPINPGHLLLIPKKHFSDIFGLPKPLYNKLVLLVKKFVPILKKASKAKRIGLAIEGFGVNHAHVHIVPVNKGNELNPLRAKKVTAKALELKQKSFLKFF